jgi:uncharacterized SAM-binding protein YcdF (DUF218 family)
VRAALVLGAKVLPDGTASSTLALRVAHAVRLWDEGRVETICVSGGQGAHGGPEGEVGCCVAAALGVPPGALVAETRSANTVENLYLAAPLLEGRRIVLVSNRWHLPRARLAAWVMGLRVEASGPRGTMSWGRTVRAAAREALATPGTVWRAWKHRGIVRRAETNEPIPPL